MKTTVTIPRAIQAPGSQYTIFLTDSSDFVETIQSKPCSFFSPLILFAALYLFASFFPG
jgi:hypothetical protein